jgi:hypothetical protein
MEHLHQQHLEKVRTELIVEQYRSLREEIIQRVLEAMDGGIIFDVYKVGYIAHTGISYLSY